MTIARRILDQQINSITKYMVDPAIDIGGEKAHSISGMERPDIDWKYLNLDPRYQPDYLCSAENIPVEDETFNTVLVFEVLEHLEKPDIAMDEVVRILKPGGRLFLSVPFMYRHHRNPVDYVRWTHEELFRKIETDRGLRIELLLPRGGWLAMILHNLTTGLYSFVPGTFVGSGIAALVGKYVGRAIDATFPWWIKLDHFLREEERTRSNFHRYTIGYLLVARKPGLGERFPRRECPDALRRPVNDLP